MKKLVFILLLAAMIFTLLPVRQTCANLIPTVITRTHDDVDPPPPPPPPPR